MPASPRPGLPRGETSRVWSDRSDGAVTRRRRDMPAQRIQRKKTGRTYNLYNTPPPYALKTVQLAVAAVSAAALMCIGAMPVEAAGPFTSQYTDTDRSHTTYLNSVFDILEYEVTEYTDFDLVRMSLSIENLQDATMADISLRLGGDISTIYHHDAYADVRARGGDVSVDDCTSNGRFSDIPSGSTDETIACFMIDKTFKPDALYIDGYMSKDSWWYTQVIPFHAESTFCFVNWYDDCNANNIQRVDDAPAPRPAPEPEPEPSEPEPAMLLHTIYNNHTGTLTLVFDQMVVAHNPDRIHLIHDVDAFIESGEAPGLGGAELHTVDNKRQSAVLAFKLSGTMWLEITESLRTHGDLAVLVDTRAVYAAEGFADVTRGTPVLVPDVMVVR